MNFKLFGFVVANLFVFQAQADVCSAIDEKVEELAESSLKAAAEINKCVYKPVTSEVPKQHMQTLEERIRGAMSFEEEVYGQRKKLRPTELEAYMLKESADPNKRRYHELMFYPNIPRGVTDPKPRDYRGIGGRIDTFFKLGVPGIKETPELREKIKEKIVETYLLTPSERRKPDCIPQIESEEGLISVRELTERDQKYNMKAYSSEVDDYMLKHNITNNFENNLKVCNPTPVLGNPVVSRPTKTPEDCHIVLTHNFPPNVAKINREEFILKNKEALAVLNACIKRNLDNKFTLENVNIYSSTDASLNSGDYLGKSFLELSKDRNDSIKNLKTDIFDPNVITVSDDLIKQEIKGTNQDGSSGPCPYDADGSRTDWYEHTHPVTKSTTAEEKALLQKYNESRYVTLYANFKYEVKQGEALPAPVTTQSLSIRCYNLRMRCD